MIVSESVRHTAVPAPSGPGPVRPASAVCVLPAVPTSVPLLRRFARDVAGRWGLPDSLHDPLFLIVTELAANAVRHSASPDVGLLLTGDGSRVIVEVRDTGRWRTAREPAGGPDQACGGRGLPLVRAFSTRCAVRRTPAGTHVVAELAVLPDRPAAPGADVSRLPQVAPQP